MGNMKSTLRRIDEHLRTRMRIVIWKQWKTPQNRIKHLMKLGVEKNTVWITAYTGKRIAYVCQRRVMNFTHKLKGILMEYYDKIIIGAGVYGLYSALFCGEKHLAITERIHIVATVGKEVDCHQLIRLFGFDLLAV